MNRILTFVFCVLAAVSVLAQQSTGESGVQHVICDSGCTGGGGGGTVDQGMGGLSPWLVSFDGAQPVSQSGAWNISFVSPQAVTQSGAWSISFTAPQHVIVDSLPTSAISAAAPSDATPVAVATRSIDNALMYLQMNTSGELLVHESTVDQLITNVGFGAAPLQAITAVGAIGAIGELQYLNVTASGNLRTTLLDGANVVEGVTTDAAVQGDNPGTISAKLRGLNKSIAAGVAVTGPLTDTQLRATAVPVSQATATNLKTQAESYQGGTAVGAANPLQVSIANTGANATAVKVDGSAVTQPVSLAANQSVNVNQLAGTTTDTNSGTKSAGTLRVVLATDQPALTNKLLVTPDALPANQSVNVSQLAGTTTDTNSGTKSAGTLRVVLATDQPALTNKLLVTPDSVALPANQSVNVSQLAGTTTDTNSGTKSAGTLRVVLATDQPALTNKLLVTPDSVALPANQSVNVNQFGGSAVVTGTGAGGAGIPRVTLSNDSSLAANQSVNVAQIGGTNTVTAAAGVQKVGIVGNANGAIDAANNAAAPANVIVDGIEVATQTSTQPTAATAGNVRRIVGSTDGVLFAKLGGPVQWQCNLGAIGTTLTQCQAAPGAGLRLYITDIFAVSTTTTSGLFTLRFGTGSNCGTGTGNVFFASAAASLPNGANNATSVKPWSFLTPIAITANNALCVLGVVTNTTNIMISGYTAP